MAFSAEMDRRVGYTLLWLGVFFILMPIGMAWMMSAGITKPPHVFDMGSYSLNTGFGSMNVPVPPQFNMLMNMGMQYALYGVMACSGWMLGMLGVQLIVKRSPAKIIEDSVKG